MLQRASAKESEGSGPCWSLKEGRTDDLNVCTSEANSGCDAKDPMQRGLVSEGKDCKSIFSYIAFRTCGSTLLETRARDTSSWRGKNRVTLSHSCEGMLWVRVYEGVDSIDTESNRVSQVDGVWLSNSVS